MFARQARVSAVECRLFHRSPEHRGPVSGICCRQTREHPWLWFGRRTNDGGGRKLGGKGLFYDALPGHVEALDEVGRQPSHRQRGGYRRQTHPLECSHGALCGLVQVQANQAGDKISATVEAVAPGIDLAVLKLEDESFFETHPPLQRASTLPGIKDAVMAYGYPEGGMSLSTTKGIVSRIEFTEYNFPVSGLRIQIDAAINPGNSGGPAVAGDKMIGLAFSHLSGAQNIGYIIPCEEIELFLQDIADGVYNGKPAMFDELRTLENPALRGLLKIGKAVQGMVVHTPFRSDPAYPLREWDVITRIGDTPVTDQGIPRFSHISWRRAIRSRLQR